MTQSQPRYPKPSPSRPHEIIQTLNRIIHTPPFDNLCYTFVWTIQLGFVIPFLALPYLWTVSIYSNLVLGFKLLYGLTRWRWSNAKSHDRVPSKRQPIHIVELGVVITGCDSGFGYELVRELEDLERGNSKPKMRAKSNTSHDDSTNTIYRYTIFAGCYDLSKTRSNLPTKTRVGACVDTNEDNDSDIADIAVVIPFQLDVTKQSDVDTAAKMVNKWLLNFEENIIGDNDDDDHEATILNGNAGQSKTGVGQKAHSAPKRTRLLHAIVNNAGVGKIGQVDWLTMDDYRICMEVNAFGPIRMCKAFFPLLKRQHLQHIQEQLRDHDQRKNKRSQMTPSLLHSSKSLNHPHCRPRIINLSSAAGLAALGGVGGSAYYMSKHALDAFTQTFRHEARKWFIDVISVNPSFHQTPLLQKTMLEMELLTFVPQDMRQEYGQEYIRTFVNHVNYCMASCAWESRNVVEALVDAIQDRNPPYQILVGTDAKYGICFFRIWPEWLRDLFAKLVTPWSIPAAITEIVMQINQLPRCDNAASAAAEETSETRLPGVDVGVLKKDK